MNTVFHLANEVRGTSRPQSPGHGVAFEEKMWLPLKNETNRPQKSYVANVDEPEQQLKRINAICLFCCLTFFWSIDVRCLVFMSVHLYRYQAIGWTADTTFSSRRSDFLLCLEPKCHHSLLKQNRFAFVQNQTQNILSGWDEKVVDLFWSDTWDDSVSLT